MVLFILFFSKKKKNFLRLIVVEMIFLKIFIFLLWKWDIECIGEFVVVNLIDLMFK